MSYPTLKESEVGAPLRQMNVRWDGLRAASGAMATFNSPRFGMTRNGGTRAHSGVDLDASVGTPVFAVADGVIEQVRFAHPMFGIDILLRFRPSAAWRGYLAHAGSVDSDGTLFAHYAHLSAASVRAGLSVRRGTCLGCTGVSGNADQRYPHLHFELRKLAKPGVGAVGLRNRIDPELMFRVNFAAPVEALVRASRTA